MLFNSVEFLIFLPLVLAIYYSLNKNSQNVWLLVASWFFYGWWDYRFLFLLATSTVVDYFCGRGIHLAESKKTRRTLLMCSLISNLSILGFFKYFNFFVDSAAEFLSLFGFEPSMVVLQILLPMGISFYTFQTMAYTIDIYRKQQEPAASFITFALYVSYFPQLVAGPIERASRLLPQLENKRVVESSKISEGLILILLGFFKKVAVADVVAPVVNQIFNDPSEYSAIVRIVGVYLFAIQIYCDFSGYTDIARGTSRLLGIDLMVNFNHPYFSTSITEFWRRWHISLSTWLRDYLYIPLGGNRHGRLNTYRNLMITMLLGGLWHGASWNFVIWGALHGMYLSVHKLSKSAKESLTKLRSLTHLRKQVSSAIPVHASGMNDNFFRLKMGHIAGGLFTFHLVCLAWILFRADDFTTSVAYLSGILDFGSLSINGLDVWAILRIVPPVLVLLFVEIAQYRKGDHTFFRNLSVWKQVGIYVILLLCIFIFGAFDEEVPFIYFQF